jgi:arylformamidase
MLDLEAEYNNRARVPEHPEIMKGWERDAAAFRHAAATRAIFNVAYGRRKRQRYDLFRPAEGRDGPAALFFHGGYWQALDRTWFSHMAAGPTANGVTVGIASYTLCPDATIAEIVDESRLAVAAVARRLKTPVAVFGHSAGGHIAAALLATDWSELTAELGFDPVTAALPISGLFELEPLVPTTINEKLQLNAEEARRLSPLFWAPPKGKRLVAVVGGAESSEFLRQTRDIVERWGAGGVAARAVEIPGADHFTVLAPFADPQSDLTMGLVALARG